jgi:hypothetical protein
MRDRTEPDSATAISGDDATSVAVAEPNPWRLQSAKSIYTTFWEKQKVDIHA